MKRLIPHPLLVVVMLVFWLMLQKSLAPGQILLGLVVALGAGSAMGALMPERLIIRHPLLIMRLLYRIVTDVLASNLEVGRLVMSGAQPRSGFLEVPLELRNPAGLAVLACIVTAVPGSAWIDYDGARSVVLIHVLDIADAEEWIAALKRRHETLLLEIFP